jgi:hypothetical protein
MERTVAAGTGHGESGTRARVGSYGHRDRAAALRPVVDKTGAYLERGWVIANHKLVSFHAAFISSVLSLSGAVTGKLETLQFMFLSLETVVSLAVLYLSWHVAIAIHEMGHYVTAARLAALNASSQRSADAMADKVSRWG